jgi:hypothetical protein
MSKGKEKRKDKHDSMMDEKMKCLFTTFTENTQKQLTEQAEKHAIQIADMKQSTIGSQTLLTYKTMATYPANDHRASAHFTAMTKACDMLFDGKPENWPAFESHLLNEAGNLTIGWSCELLNFQLIDQTTKTFNFMEGYFNILDSMIDAMKDDLERTKAEDLQKQTLQLYRLYSLKIKLKNCLTPDLARDIETSMPDEVSNTYGRIFIINIISNTFPEKEAHIHTICEYIMKLEITQSNNMEAFQHTLSCHIKQYDVIKGKE